MNRLHGIAASRGIAIGPVFQFQKAEVCFERCLVPDPAAEWDRFQTAIETASQQIAEIKGRAEAECRAEEAAIFEAHMLMLEDPELLEAVQIKIEDGCINAESALSDAAETYVELLESLEDEYFRARAADVRDVTERVLCALLNLTDSPVADLSNPSIILARDLTPSDTVLLDKSLVLGF